MISSTLSNTQRKPHVQEKSGSGCIVGERPLFFQKSFLPKFILIAAIDSKPGVHCILVLFWLRDVVTSKKTQKITKGFYFRSVAGQNTENY